MISTGNRGVKMSRYKTPKPFKKFCRDCEELFQPTGRFQKYCIECQKKRQGGRGWIKR